MQMSCLLKKYPASLLVGRNLSEQIPLHGSSGPSRLCLAKITEPLPYNIFISNGWTVQGHALDGVLK